MNRRSFFLQFYFILIGIIIIPTVLISYISLGNTLSYAEEKIAETSMHNMESAEQTNRIVLFNMIKNTLRLTQSSSFRSLRGLNTYEELNANYTNVSHAMDASTTFAELLYNDSSIHSVFFLMDGADYVVSSDQGISKLEDYADTTWVEEAVGDEHQISGFWILRRENKSETRLLSYIYSLNTLASSIKGNIVVNVYESRIQENIDPAAAEDGQNVFLLDSHGTIISHGKKSYLGRNETDSGYYQKIMGSQEPSGFFFMENDGERYLYSYVRSEFNDWIYVATQSMDSLMAGVIEQHQALLVKIGLTVIAVIALLVMAVYRLLRPMKDLLETVTDAHYIPEKKHYNEVVYISEVFKKIKDQTQALNTMLLEQETDVQRFALRELINGERLSDDYIEELHRLFPYKQFMVAMVEFDNKESYLNRYNAEEIKFFRLWIHEWIQERLNKEGINVAGVRYATSSSAIIINIKEYDQGAMPKILSQCFSELQKELIAKTDFSVSIGISLLHLDLAGVVTCVDEAGEALKNKLTLGQGSIIFWKSYMKDYRHYFYPYKSEERIINYLCLGRLDSIEKELIDIRAQILSHENLAHDNILLIYNQLVGVTLKYLVENNLNSGKIFGHYSNVYSTIAKKDTIEAIETFLLEFYEGIIKYMSQNDSPIEVGHCERIVAYLNEHYKEEILFDEMAEELGISYSYMRKIIKESTGMSLIDCLNTRRIEEAKKILPMSNEGIESIALELGYNNVQSFNRYFKKFEGIAPGKFRELNIAH